MRTSALQRLLRYIFWAYCAVSMSFGLLMLVSNYQGEHEGDTSSGSLGLFVLSLTFILLPLAVFFIVKAVKSYRGMNSKYGLPDSPERTLILLTASGLMVVFILVTIAIFAVVFNSQ